MFANNFFSFLTSLAVPAKFWQAQLAKCDFSRLANVRLCISLAGVYLPSSAEYQEKRYGFPALGRVVKELGMVPKKGETLHLECQ